ncbi:prokaryotic cytochrome b561 domain-containing protein [Ditylenchus destructor]|nr:prokaryotic cytochrome b561 domain-containing protein [Ditylenchus destructor]
MAFHWLLALLIIGTFSVGWYMSDLPFSMTRLKLFNWHKWAGVTILALSALGPAVATGESPARGSAHARLAEVRPPRGALAALRRVLRGAAERLGLQLRGRLPDRVVRRAAAARLRRAGQGAGRDAQGSPRLLRLRTRPAGACPSRRRGQARRHRQGGPAQAHAPEPRLSAAIQATPRQADKT